MGQVAVVTEPGEASHIGGWKPVIGRLGTAGVVAALLLALAQPLPGRAGVPTWALIGLFLGASWLVRGRLTKGGPASIQAALLEITLAALAYALGATPIGPLAAVLVLVMLGAVTRLPFRLGVLSTLAVAAVVGLNAPTMPGWDGSTEGVRELGALLIVITCAGIGAACLRQGVAPARLPGPARDDAAPQAPERDRTQLKVIEALAHDLRTPLTAAQAAMGLLELKLQDRAQPEERRLFENAQRNLNRVNTLVDDLLTYNQVQAAALHLHCELIDLRAVVANAAAVVHPLVLGKQQTIKQELNEPLLLIGDALRLEQVFVNLLANAHEHTPYGTQITIAGAACNSYISIAVCDNGPGVPPTEFERVFQSFERVDHRSGGSGLGLSIAKMLTEQHSGRIWIERAIGGGTVIRVTLPQ